MHNPASPPRFHKRLWRMLVGAPHDLRDRGIHRHLALIPLLAWFGLGADGLSSSAYGPEEAFRTLGDHAYLAVALAVVTAGTVFLIAAAYSKIIEHFPQGGGGYVVATALLGQKAGVVSGCALLIDYVLTITISIAAAGAALFSFVPPQYHWLKLPTDVVLIVVLSVLNLRGVRESVVILAPIFITFVVTHAIALVYGFASHVPQMAQTAADVGSGFQSGLTTLGVGGMLLLFLKAFSLGGGTYTGIEAVSNGLGILREPRVPNGKRTMLLMSCSLAIMAAGLLMLYLLWGTRPTEGQTMNAVLMQQMTAGIPGGAIFALITLLSEGALLVVAAQAGFVDGPRVMANMAIDSWMPHRLGALSERLTTHNGIAFMAVASLIALLYTRGNVHLLVVLYSINVFVTFSLSMSAMLRRALTRPPRSPGRRGEIVLFGVGFLLCATILAVTVFEKFNHGGWVTILITGSLVAVCLLIKRHYQRVYATLNQLYAELEKLPQHVKGTAGPLDPKQPTAALLVGSYGGVGIHTLMNIFRAFPGYHKNVLFLSAGVVDSGEFKGENSVDALRAKTVSFLDQYVALAGKLGVPSGHRVAIGTDAVETAEQLCLEVAKEFPNVVFFAGKVIFEKENWYHRLLHNETALAIQKRLQWAGRVLVVLPARVSALPPKKPATAAGAARG